LIFRTFFYCRGTFPFAKDIRILILARPQASLEAIPGPLSFAQHPGRTQSHCQSGRHCRRALAGGASRATQPAAGYFPFIGILFPTESATAAFYLALSGIPTPLGDPGDPATRWVLTEDPVAQLIRGLA